MKSATYNAFESVKIKRGKVDRHHQGLRNGFHLGVAHSNADFEKVDFQKNL